jgi:carbonic anhydrase
VPPQSDPTLERLKSGIRRFQSEVYSPNAAAYRESVCRPQKPHTLVVACADSRVDIEAITSGGPGEVFIARNVGNMAPAYGETPGGIGSVIEYAVAALAVSHIVVCGHSDCGAMKALLPDAAPIIDEMPYVDRWLTHGRAALRIAQEMHRRQPERDLLSILTEQNAFMQVAHLRTHPHVAGAVARGLLTLSAWVYDIGSGTVRIWRDGNPQAGPEVLVPASTADGA